MSILRHTLAALLLLTATTSTSMADSVREAGLIESFPIRGISLSLSDREAFERLVADGYTANGIASYADWTTGGLSMVKGIYGHPDGHSEIALSRTPGGRLVNISETYNRVGGGGIDADAEIQAMRDHFSIATDDPDCQGNGHGAGHCRVADAEENANNAIGLTILPIMIMRYATRNHELLDSY